MKTSEIFKNYNSTDYSLTDYKATSLNNFTYMAYSQNGEDGIIEEIFSRIPISKKFFIEFGGWDGVNLSNTANLRINKSWDGILFEGDEEKVSVNKETINIHHEYITSNNVNKIFEKYKIPKNFGLLSIDIDGDDAYIFESIDYKKYSPDLIIVEYNPGLPNHIPIRYKEQGINQTRENCEKGYFGANINSFYEIAKSKGYEFVTTCNWNLFFIKDDLFDFLKIKKMSKDEIMNTQSNSFGSFHWREIITKHEMDWVIK